MSQQDGPIFEDCELKAALRRCLCNEQAPAPLRERIAQAVATQAATIATTPLAPSPILSTGTMRLNPTSASPATFSTLLPGLAIAASMILAIGSIALILSRSSQTLPHQFEAAAVARHDGCCEAADHHNPTMPQATFARIGQYLQQQLHHPVLAADMTKDGWQFSGVSICPVGGIDAAHLLFRRNLQTLSVFSLPASAIPTLDDHQSYEARTADGHTVVARMQDGAVYCLVGKGTDGDLTIDELDQLLDHHGADATVAATPGPPIILAGIPREP